MPSEYKSVRVRVGEQIVNMRVPKGTPEGDIKEIARDAVMSGMRQDASPSEAVAPPPPPGFVLEGQADENPLARAGKKAVTAIPERISEQFDFMRRGLMGAAKPLDEGVIPENVMGVDIPDVVRGPANVVAGAGQALLGVFGMAESPLAAPNEFFGELAAEEQRRTLTHGILARGRKFELSPEEEKFVEDHAQKSKTAVGLIAETLFGAAATKRVYGVKTPKLIKGEVPVNRTPGFGVVSEDPLPPIPGTPARLPGRSPRPLGSPKAGLSSEIEKDIQSSVLAAIDDGTFNAEKGERIFRSVARAIADGDIDAPSWERIRAKIMKLGNITQQEADVALANEYLIGITEHGRGLQRLSRIKKAMKKFLHKDAMDVLEGGPDTSAGFGEPVLRGIGKMEQTRRGFLTTQMATATRNFVEQTGRFTLQTATDAMEGVLKVATGTSPREAFRQTFEDLVVLGRRLSPSGREKLGKILENMPLQAAKLLRRPVAEVTLGKITDKLNILNRTQEYFFRKLGFEARLRTNLAKIGIKIDEMSPEEIGRLAMGSQKSKFNVAVEDAIDHALRITYARTPSGKEMKKVLGVFNHWIATSLGNPFPRFWMNSIELLFNHSPTGVLRMLKPETVRAMASGDFTKATKVMSEAMTGTMLLAGAGAIRESQYGEDRPWYQIKTGEGKVIDARVYGATARYLFLWEAIFHPENLDAGDWAEGLFLVNRVAGTGLVLTDILRAKDSETFQKIVQKFAGQYVSGFTVPVRTFKDFIAQIDPEERKIRSTKESPLTGPSRGNIPFVSQGLPERRSPYKEGTLKADSPAIRQLTGLSMSEKNTLESEVDRLNLRSNVYPKMGDLEANRLVVAEMGQFAERLILPWLKKKRYQKRYQKMPDAAKRLLLRRLFKRARKQAVRKAIPKNVALFRRLRLESKDPDVLELLGVKADPREYKSVRVRVGEQIVNMRVPKGTPEGDIKEIARDAVMSGMRRGVPRVPPKESLVK